MHSTSHRFPRPSSFLATLVASCWLAVQLGRAQTLDASFGVIRAYSVPGEFERLTRLSLPGEQLTHVLLWTPRNATGAVVTFDTSASYHVRTVVFPSRFDDVRTLSLDDSAPPSLMLMDRAKRLVLFTTFPTEDSVRVVGTLALPIEADGIAVGDLNNDRRDDLLFYARNTPGVIAYLNRGQARFLRVPDIAPDNPVGSLTLMHLNDDRVVDVVLYDWVRSELHFLYGVGRGRFFDQTTVKVSGEVREVVGTDLNRDGLADILLWYSKPASFQWMEADGLGDFQPRSMVELGGASRLAVADVNVDGWPDVTVLTARSSLHSFFLTGDETIDHSELFCGSGRDLVLGDLNGDEFNDALVVLPQERRLVAFLNAQAKVSLTDSLDFATGLQPVACTIVDANSDGKNDVLVLNSDSRSLSVFFGWGSSVLGQVAYTVPAGPSSMTTYAVRDSALQIIVSHALDRSLSVFTVNFRDNSSIAATIPDVGVREVISESVSQPGAIRFYCSSLPEHGVGPSLLFFQQIGVQTFIEQSFRLTVPDTLLGAVVTDVSGDGYADVVYVFRNSTTGKFALATSLGDSASGFLPRSFELELKESAIQESFLWSADFNGDGKRDILLCFPDAPRALKVALGAGDGTFQEPQLILEGVKLSDRRQLRLVDFDRDGVMDIVLNNASARQIGWLKGRGDGSFEPISILVPGEGISHFAVGDVNGDGVNDLAVVFRDRGVLRVYHGALFFGNREKASN